MSKLRSHVADRVRELVSSERGIALPVALLITVITLSFAAVPIVASINSQSGGSHNQGGNEALAAAEAGAEIAILHQRQQIAADSSVACAEEDGTELGSNGWCTAIDPPRSIGAAEYRYQLRPCYAEKVAGGSCETAAEASACSAGEDEVQVVSTGIATVGGRQVQKRVEVRACPSVIPGAPSGLTEWEEDLISLESAVSQKTIEREYIEKILTEEVEKGENVKEIPGKPVPIPPVIIPPPNIYASGQVVGIDWLKMNNNAQVYTGGAGSNGAVSMVGSANVCGTVGYGTTFTTDNSSSKSKPSNCVSRTAAKGTTTYPPITLPADIATNNSNARLAAADPVGSGVWQRGNISWNASNKSLTVNYDQLTLEGTAPYYLCKLTLAGGSKLLSGVGKAIRIYFAPPESCPGLNGGAQLQFANGTYIAADAANGPALLFAGSATSGASKIEMAGGSVSSQFVVYAPLSTIVANNGVYLHGVIIGRTLELGGGASINSGSAFTPPAPETFLPSTEEKGKEVPGTPEHVTSDTTIQHETERKLIESETIALEDEIERIRNEHGEDPPPPPGPDVVSGLSRESFTECSAEPEAEAPFPNSGC